MTGEGTRAAYLDLAPVARAAGTVALPGSKSISNRALLLAALADGETELLGLLDDCLGQLTRERIDLALVERRAVGDPVDGGIEEGPEARLAALNPGDVAVQQVGQARQTEDEQGQPRPPVDQQGHEDRD